MAHHKFSAHKNIYWALCLRLLTNLRYRRFGMTKKGLGNSIVEVGNLHISYFRNFKTADEIIIFIFVLMAKYIIVSLFVKMVLL